MNTDQTTMKDEVAMERLLLQKSDLENPCDTLMCALHKIWRKTVLL